jgi:hypothetical protein
MQLKKYEIKTYVTKDIYQRVSKEAGEKKSTMAQVIREGLIEYFLLREELANAIESPGNLGENHTGKVIHTLLARTEERMSLTVSKLEKKLDGFQQKQELLIAMVDQFYLSLMQCIPKPHEELTSAAIAAANLRYQQWLKDVEKILQN